MKSPFYSIVIPTYNAEKTLPKAIESVLSQSPVDFEILIRDEVSTDNTLKIARSFNDNRIRIYSEPDKGIYDAMNKGIKLAKGQWLYFLGSDDVLFDNTVLYAVHKFLITKTMQVVYGDVFIEGDATWAKDGDVYDGNFTVKKLLTKNICHQSIFYKRDFLLKNKLTFSLQYPICSDWDFNLKCWKKSRFLYLPGIMAVFKAGGASTRKDIDDLFFRDIKKYRPRDSIFLRVFKRILHKVNRWKAHE